MEHEQARRARAQLSLWFKHIHVKWLISCRRERVSQPHEKNDFFARPSEEACSRTLDL